MTDFLADRLNKYSIAVTGISPYGFGSADMFWEIPDGWSDVTELTQGVPPEQSGVMLLRADEPTHGFFQNVATYTWVLDGRVPFETIFTGLKEPVPVDAGQVSSLSAIDHVSDTHAEARLITRFNDDERDMVSTTLFTWYKLDGTGTRFDDPSVLIQRTLVAVDAEQESVPTFTQLPDSVDKLGQ